LFVQNINIHQFERQPKLAQITEQECLNALNNMSNNKLPGSDGFSAEFYKYFWKDIRIMFLNCFKFSFEVGQLSDSQRDGIIIMLPKAQKDLLKPQNYRPITPLNTDYKIVASVINNRIKQYLNLLIQSGQNAFIKGRSISDNIRLLFDVIDFSEAKHIPGSILCVDILKALIPLTKNLCLRFNQNLALVLTYCNGLKHFTLIHTAELQTITFCLNLFLYAEECVRVIHYPPLYSYYVLNV